MYIHTIRACYINQNTGYFQFDTSLKDNRSDFKLPKIYVPWPLHQNMIYKERYPGIPFHLNRDDEVHHKDTLQVLKPIEEELRVHHEYLAGTYLMHRLFHDRRLSTNNIEEADLCYPTCSAYAEGQTYELLDGNRLQFQVKPNTSSLASKECSVWTIGIETLMTHCSFSVPYWHSIYYPSRSSGSLRHAAFQLLNASLRTKRLCYVGGMVRGIGRAKVIDELYALNHYTAPQAMGTTLTKQQLYSGFFNYTIRPGTDLNGNEWNTPQLFKRVWEMYATSIFSWQPEGDTETRRGFYDAWMMGCIPVISESAACTYAGLFGGALFRNAAPLEDIVIVLDDAVMYDAVGIMHHLAHITEAEITLRRERMAKLAPFMQWGWSEDSTEDALIAALRVLTLSLRPQTTLFPGPNPVTDPLFY